MKFNWLKIAGLLTAAGAAIVAIKQGQLEVAFGVLGAALSSPTIFNRPLSQ